MRNLFFPTTIVDGFFDNPDTIRQFALSQKYDYVGNNYPGKRTNFLSKINREIFETVAYKIIDLFFTQRNNIRWNAEMHFQIIDEKYNHGMVHRDNSIITAVIYLNPNHKKNSGTKIYRKIKVDSEDAILEHKLAKQLQESYATCSAKSTDVEQHNSLYEEVMFVEGLYNRLLIFDSHLYHSSCDAYGENSNDSRLTLISFFNGIECGEQLFPIQRAHKNAILLL